MLASTSWRPTFFFQAEDGIRDRNVTGVQTCALPIFVMHVELAMNLTPRSSDCRGPHREQLGRLVIIAAIADRGKHQLLGSGQAMVHRLLRQTPVHHLLAQISAPVNTAAPNRRKGVAE